MKQVDIAALKSLSEMMYKKARIIATNGKVYEGEFDSYTDGMDAADGNESIGFSHDGGSICFTRQDMMSVEIECQY